MKRPIPLPRPIIPVLALSLCAAELGLFAPTLLAAESVDAGSLPGSTSQSAASGSHAPVFSAHGRSVAFVSRANNLVAQEDLNTGWDVFVRSRDTHDTALASVSRSGRGGGNGPSLMPALSANGSVVVFQSEASDLVDNDGNAATDIYQRDLASDRTTLVSVNHQGTASGNGRSWNPLISADGRHVVFESRASDLVTSDFNGTNDIFIRDLAAGVTSLVSVNAEGTSSPDGASDSPSISSDARFIAFVSRGANLVAGATNRLGEIYVRDVLGQSNYWAVGAHLTSARDPVTLSYAASQPVLSADGRYVAFKTQRGTLLRFDLSRETNTVFITFPGSPGSAFQFHDNPRVGGAAGGDPNADIVLSADGRHLAFVSGATFTPSNTVFRTDFDSFSTNVLETAESLPEGIGFLTNQTPVVEVVSTLRDPSGMTANSVPMVLMSTNGSVLSFLSDSTNLVEQPTRGTVQLYLRNMNDGPVRLVSTNASGEAGVSRAGSLPALDPGGRWLACESADGLVSGDLNHAPDIYLYEVEAGGIELVSATAPGRPTITAAGHSYARPKGLSADGRYLAFSTLDRGLPLHDTNLNHVVRVRSLLDDLEPAFPKLTNGFQRDPVLSADGRYLAYFRGVPSSTSYLEYQAVRRDLMTGAEDVFACPLVPAFSQVMMEQWAHDLSLDGRYLVHGGKALNVEVFLVFRDLLTGSSNVVTVGLNGRVTDGANPAFSPDARWLAFLTQQNFLTPEARRGLHVWDRVAQTNRWLTDGVVGFNLTNGFAFSANSEWIAFGRSNHVLLHHLLEATNLVAFTKDARPRSVATAAISWPRLRGPDRPRTTSSSLIAKPARGV